jgi:hypothetical protein
MRRRLPARHDTVLTRAGQVGDRTNLPAKSSVQQRRGVADPASGGDPGTGQRFEGAIDQLDCQAVLAEHEEKSLVPLRT